MTAPTVALLLPLLLLALAHAAPLPTQRYRLKSPSVRAFTPDEFYATYALMVQYKYGQVPNCPSVWKYKGTPLAEADDLFLSHSDMQVASPTANASELMDCDHTGALHLLRSTRLNASVIDSLKSDIANDVDKTTVFNSVLAHLTGHLYYVSTGTEPVTCAGKRWWDNNEMVIFFDESDTVKLSVVAKIHNGGPRVLTLPLIGNIRYMLSVRAGTTCIYRVESDVQQLLNDTTRPSDSPSPTPQVPLTDAAQRGGDAPPASPSPTPASSTVVTVVLQSATPSASPNPNVTEEAPAPRPSATVAADTTTENNRMRSTPSPRATNPGPQASATPQATGPVPMQTTASPSSSRKGQSPTVSYDATPEFVPPAMRTMAPGAFDTLSDMYASPEASDGEEGRNDGVVNWPRPSDESREDADDDRLVDATPQPKDEEENDVVNVKGGGECFPADAQVRLSDGRMTTMSQLRIGDEVAIGNGKFSPVVLFTHREDGSNGAKHHRFHTLWTTHDGNGTRLRATGRHMVYANGKLRLMQDVNVGDMLKLVNGTSAAVVKVTHEWHTGLYNPQTASGDIAVDGVVASCYTSAMEATSAHSLLLPVRAAAQRLPGLPDAFWYLVGDAVGSLRVYVR